MSKGSSPRRVDQDKFGEEFDRIFRQTAPAPQPPTEESKPSAPER